MGKSLKDKLGETSLMFASSNSERHIELPEYYVKGQELPDDESRNLEFKQCAKCPSETFCQKITKYVCGFLNTVGGTLMLGVTDDGIVHGMELTRKQKDQLRLDVDKAMEIIQPLVVTEMCPLDFISVRPEGEAEGKSEGLPADDNHRFVVCLSVPMREKGVMYLAGKDVFVKRNGEVKKLEGSEVRDFTRMVDEEKVKVQLSLQQGINRNESGEREATLQGNDESDNVKKNQKSFYDICLMSSGHPDHVARLTKIFRKHEWVVHYLDDSTTPFGALPTGYAENILETSSHIVILLDEEECRLYKESKEKSHRLEMAFQLYFESERFGGVIIPIHSCNKKDVPLSLKALTGGNIESDFLEGKLVKVIDTRIRKKREENR